MKQLFKKREIFGFQNLKRVFTSSTQILTLAITFIVILIFYKNVTTQGIFYLLLLTYVLCPTLLPNFGLIVSLLFKILHFQLPLPQNLFFCQIFDFVHYFQSYYNFSTKYMNIFHVALFIIQIQPTINITAKFQLI